MSTPTALLAVLNKKRKSNKQSSNLSKGAAKVAKVGNKPKRKFSMPTRHAPLIDLDVEDDNV